MSVKPPRRGPNVGKLLASLLNASNVNKIILKRSEQILHNE